MDDKFFDDHDIEQIAETDTELVYKIANDKKIHAAYPDFVTSALGVNGSGDTGRPSLVFRGEWRPGKGEELEPFDLFMEMPSADFVMTLILNNLASILSETSVEMIKQLVITMANEEVEQGIPTQLEVASKEHENAIREAVLRSRQKES